MASATEEEEAGDGGDRRPPGSRGLTERERRPRRSFRMAWNGERGTVASATTAMATAARVRWGSSVREGEGGESACGICGGGRERPWGRSYPPCRRGRRGVSATPRSAALRPLWSLQRKETTGSGLGRTVPTWAQWHGPFSFSFSFCFCFLFHLLFYFI